MKLQTAFRTLPRRMVGVAVLIGVLLGAASAPARAATSSASAGATTASAPQLVSGGGCRGSTIAACVSFSPAYQRASADFYLNSSLYYGCTVTLTLHAYINNVWYENAYTVRLDHVGRYGEIHIYTGGWWGWAWSDVSPCYGSGRQESPYVYFP